MTRRPRVAAIVGLTLALLSCGAAQAVTPETVHFDSDDGHTRLTAYLYTPATPGPHPAVVALHGRTGLYSSRGRVYDAGHLAPHKTMWGAFWTSRGHIVLFVDTFGPRGYPAGFAAGTIKQRPPEINEITIRPLDAYAGLRFLRSRADVVPGRIFLQGWSNGGSATLSAMAAPAPGRPGGEGFRAAIAIYPACTQVHDHYRGGYRTYAPLLLLLGTHDAEVKPASCRALAEVARGNGSALELVLYDGAEHSYDTPIPSRERVPANVAAAADTKRRVEAFVAR
jgi:carboxymethylenebutenolidase